MSGEEETNAVGGHSPDSIVTTNPLRPDDGRRKSKASKRPNEPSGSFGLLDLTNLSSKKRSSGTSRSAAYQHDSKLSSSFTGIEDLWFEHAMHVGGEEKRYFHQPTTGEICWERPLNADVRQAEEKETNPKPAPQPTTEPKPTPPATDSQEREGDEKIVTECAWRWTVIGYLLTCAHTAIYAAFALTKDNVYSDFYGWIYIPISATFVSVSFMLKPRRTDFKYKALLFSQVAVLTLGSEVSAASRCQYSQQLLSPVVLLLTSIHPSLYVTPDPHLYRL